MTSYTSLWMVFTKNSSRITQHCSRSCSCYRWSMLEHGHTSSPKVRLESLASRMVNGYLTTGPPRAKYFHSIQSYNLTHCISNITCFELWTFIGKINFKIISFIKGMILSYTLFIQFFFDKNAVKCALITSDSVAYTKGNSFQLIQGTGNFECS